MKFVNVRNREVSVLWSQKIVLFNKLFNCTRTVSDRIKPRKSERNQVKKGPNYPWFKT